MEDFSVLQSYHILSTKICSTELQGHVNSLPIFAINVYSGTLVYSENAREQQYQ